MVCTFDTLTALLKYIVIPNKYGGKKIEFSQSTSMADLFYNFKKI